MRRSLYQSAQRAASAARVGAPTALTRPFICASCRRAVLRTSIASSRTTQRPFTIAISRRQQASTSEAQIPQQETVLAQTHYDIFPSTFPNGPPPQSSFTPDLRQLRKEYLQLQGKSHPDLAPAGQKRHAEALNMRVNEAYKTLQDPLRRAQYLLSLQGIDVEDESAKLEENELLMEVMEAREAVEEVENEDDLVSLRAENNERIEASVTILEDVFARNDLETAAQEAVRLRYWMNIEESIQGWEKGRGGGVIHH